MKILFICILWMLFVCSVAFAGELEERDAIEDNVSQMFTAEKFDELSKLSKKYLETEERTSSGLWKLTMFYVGLHKGEDNKTKEDKYWTAREQKALRWAQSQPNSPSGYMAYSMMLIRHGWMYRGDGWASEVSEENWKPFYSYIGKAKKYLLDNKSIASKDPRWYELMLTVATAEGWSEKDFDLLTNEAISKFPYFYQIYFGAIEYLMPKWHGSKEKIEQFAQRSVSATSVKEKTGMYARIYWSASQTNFGTKLFTDSAVTWSRMSKAIDDVLERYPDQWNINNFAYFSCLAHDKDKTEMLINRIEGQPMASVWGGTNTSKYFDQCKAWASWHAVPQKK